MSNNNTKYLYGWKTTGWIQGVKYISNSSFQVAQIKVLAVTYYNNGTEYPVSISNKIYTTSNVVSNTLIGVVSV